jgi:AraC-like DNA-binding protein
VDANGMAETTGSIMVDRLVDHFHDLPMRGVRIVQLGAGEQAAPSLHALDRDLILIHTHSKPLTVWEVLPDPDWIALTVPLRWKGDYMYNGLLAEPGDLFLWSGGDAYAARGADRVGLGVGLRRSRLNDTIGALLGGGRMGSTLEEGRIRPGAQAGNAMHRQLAAGIRRSLDAPLGNGCFRMPPSVANGLMSDLAFCLVAHAVSAREREPGRINARPVVRAAQDAMAASGCVQPSLSDLCAAAGVGQTWLHKCFVEICGVPPMAYLRARRLSTARDRLLDPETPPASVKDVSLSLGFINSGRFAADYRGLFGETPSMTLAKRMQAKRHGFGSSTSRSEPH